MSIDKTLKIGDALVRRRNVLTRAERIEKLEATGTWKATENSPVGLPKVRVFKAKKKAKVKKVKKEEES